MVAATPLSSIKPEIAPAQIAAGEQATTTLDVPNTDMPAGDGVVQLYVRYPESQVGRPVRKLKGFRRIYLAAGESTSVEFILDAGQLAHCALFGPSNRSRGCVGGQLLVRHPCVICAGRA